MKLLVLVLGLVLITLRPASAQQVDVRSGEHDTFSRLVFMLPPGAAWSTARVDGGYRLTTPGRDTRFDLSKIFNLIPKTRILAVEPDVDGRSVFIATPPSVHLESFGLPIGAAVIDIVDGADMSPDLAVAPPPEPIRQGYRSRPATGYLDLYWARSSTSSGAAEMPSAAPTPPPEPSPAIKPTLGLPDPRVQHVERDLVDQMGRAASQGLITMALPKRNTAESAPETETPAAPAPPAAEAQAELPVQSETVIDRDTMAARAQGRLSDTGHSCPSDDDFDILSWLNDKPASEQITEARRDLVGEFDRPRPEAVLNLAKVYIGFGFGVEAKSALRSFEISPEDSGVLLAMADIVDGIPHEPDPRLSGMTTCDGKVAMWSLLDLDKAPRKEDVNFGAVLRAYSALPPTLRELVGPSLSSRLIEMGAADVATTVRSMLARAPLTHQTALEVMDAQLNLNAGRHAEATQILDGLAKAGTPVAAEALVTSIETKLSQGAAIPAADVDNASALAMQMRGTEIGARLTQAEVLGLGSTGQFNEAFRVLEKWEDQKFADKRRDTLNDLAGLLGKVPDDQLFLETFFRQREQIDPAALDDAVQITLADRLSNAGFWQSAKGLLTAPTRRSPAGRLALARAAMAAHDAAAAYSHLAGLSGDEAAALRGKAMSQLGNHDTAETEFAKAGATEAQVEEAWRSGNWNLVAKEGSETQKRFVELFAPTPAASEATPDLMPTGPLANAQQLIAQSQSEREALAKLLEELKSP